MRERIKNLAACSMPVVATMGYAMTSFAEDGTASLADTATTSLVAAVTEMAGSIGDAISQVIPIAIPLVGAGLVITIGLSVFKRITGKA